MAETYCYINNDSHNWHWQSSGGEPLIPIFSAGMIESATYDHLRIYDGPDNTSTPVYDHVGATEDLAGLQVIAASGHIYMENTSDGSVSLLDQCSVAMELAGGLFGLHPRHCHIHRGHRLR
ncbi:MAG: hypothetical protein IPL81_13575 [Flavobacteriales bacterium]|nr:hypothetical protein [Flavobacteriales bacterium]